jgi:outer membrane protein assembly factor BamB
MYVKRTSIGVVLSLLCLALTGPALANEPGLMFDANDNGDSTIEGTVVLPWRTVALDQAYGGQWVIAGDIDRDGKVEIVSAENHNAKDVHHTSAVAAQELNGQTIWRWGSPSLGRKKWHHDVACQIHDWDRDGNPEVVLCGQGCIVELDGKTGREKRRITIPQDATDCLTFCDLSGKGWPSDVLVKNRYRQ